VIDVFSTRERWALSTCYSVESGRGKKRKSPQFFSQRTPTRAMRSKRGRGTSLWPVIAKNQLSSCPEGVWSVVPCNSHWSTLKLFRLWKLLLETSKFDSKTELVNHPRLIGFSANVVAGKIWPISVNFSLSIKRAAITKTK